MIRINEQYFIDADTYNIILKEKKVIKDTESKNVGQERFEDVGYYPNVETAILSLFEKKCKKLVKETEFKNYKSVVQEFRNIKTELVNEIISLNMSVSSPDVCTDKKLDK